MTTTRKRGRPSRADASKRALLALLQAGIDPETINPRSILASIAADTSAPASARVSACRALMVCAVPAQPGSGDFPEGAEQPRPSRRNGKAAAGDLSERALRLLSGRAAN
jgi:hypothetical protein